MQNTVGEALSRIPSGASGVGEAVVDAVGRVPEAEGEESAVGKTSSPAPSVASVVVSPKKGNRVSRFFGRLMKPKGDKE